MASLTKRLPDNVEGDVFVDSTCIDCDTCRWMAPEVFAAAGDHAYVAHQPADERELERALQALVSCPTGSIGTRARHDLRAIRDAFPLPIEDEVAHCGFHSEQSFGAASYFIRRPPERGGNVLVDSPRFTKPLVKRLEALGGVATLFLTHVDDVAEHERFRAHFGCARVMHAADARPAGIAVERELTGLEPVALDAELLAVPTPGHTAGSACLIHREKFLFSGDHVAWSERRQHIYAFRDACWHDWDEQCASMERLARLRFTTILPGHGRRCAFDAERMQREMQVCVAWMRAR